MALPLGPYSPAVRAGNFLYLSGQIGIDDSELVEGLEAQVRQAMANVKELLTEQSLDYENIIKTTLFLTDISQFGFVNEIYAEILGDSRPARSTVEVSALPKGALFEIEVIAYSE